MDWAFRVRPCQLHLTTIRDCYVQGRRSTGRRPRLNFEQEAGQLQPSDAADSDASDPSYCPIKVSCCSFLLLHSKHDKALMSTILASDAPLWCKAYPQNHLLWERDNPHHLGMLLKESLHLLGEGKRRYIHQQIPQN